MLHITRHLAVQTGNREAALPHRGLLGRIRRDQRIHHHRPGPRHEARARRNARGDDAVDDHALRDENLRRGEAARPDVFERLLHVGGEAPDLRRRRIGYGFSFSLEHGVPHLRDAKHGHAVILAASADSAAAARSAARRGASCPRRRAHRARSRRAPCPRARCSG